MATFDEMILTHRLFMRGYPFSLYKIDPVPCTPLKKPLSQAKVALLTTAGLYVEGQTKFDSKIKLGDCSFREIPNTVEVQKLKEGHRSSAFDHKSVAIDKNLVLPLDRFREMLQEGEIGSLNHRHFSFMGAVIGPGDLINKTAPEVAVLLKQDEVDIAFLTPV
jgi:D-proline reductase (dithiol) PrdB